MWFSSLKSMRIYQKLLLLQESCWLHRSLFCQMQLLSKKPLLKELYKLYGNNWCKHFLVIIGNNVAVEAVSQYVSQNFKTLLNSKSMISYLLFILIPKKIITLISTVKQISNNSLRRHDLGFCCALVLYQINANELIIFFK